MQYQYITYIIIYIHIYIFIYTHYITIVNYNLIVYNAVGIVELCAVVLAARRGAAASQADPGALIGEKLRTEEDVLFLPSAKLRGFEGLSASEAEVVLTMLLAPYLRIPLLLGFLGTWQRVGALADDRLQGVLEAAVFEPGPWRSTTCPREVPK
ncbi:unnamed protein product, partial [Cladocopium goreaui]